MFDAGSGPTATVRGLGFSPEEDPALVRARLGLVLPDDGGAPTAVIERLLQLSDFTHLMGLEVSELVEVTAAFAAVEAWAAAGVRAAAARLHTRHGLGESDPVPPLVPGVTARVGCPGPAADDLAMRLGLTRAGAALLVGQGRLLEGVLNPVGEALTQGRLDAGKAGIFAELLAGQPVAVCFAVTEQVLPIAPGLPHHALRKRIAGVLIQVDPTNAHLRATAAATLRRVEHPRLLPDGQASLRVIGPVMDIATIYTLTEAAAKAAHAGGDPRTLDQLRADALTTLTATALTRGTLTHVPGYDTLLTSDDDDLVVDPADVFTGIAQQEHARRVDATPLGLARRTADAAARALGRQGRRRHGRVPTGLEGDEDGPPCLSLSILHAQPPPDPGAALPASSGPGAVLPASTGAAAPDGTRPVPALADGSGSADDAAAGTPTFPALVPFSGTTAHLTLAMAPEHLAEPAPDHIDPADPWAFDLDPTLTPADLTGPDGARYASYEAPTTCRPGIDVPELLGFAPLDPTTARTQAHDPPRWLTITTTPADLARTPDPDSATEQGNEVDPAPHLATTSYRPGARLDRLVRALHPTCIAPACTVPSTACDNDHTIEWPTGPTTATNLRPLCRHHHNLKTHHGHTYRIAPDGSTLWTTSTGHTYHRHPSGDTTLIRVPAPAPGRRREPRPEGPDSAA